MTRRMVAVFAILGCVTATGCASGSAARWAGSVPAAGAPPAVRVMPLGDSITGSPGCWRAYLWDKLRRAGFADGDTPLVGGVTTAAGGPAKVAIDFVGTRGGQVCPTGYPQGYPAHDGDNEGHGGFTAAEAATGRELPAWLARTRPHVVLMHLGTNDVRQGRTTAQVLRSYTALVALLRASDPGMVVLVAQLIPMAPADCPACGRRVVELNRAIPGWAAAASTAASPVLVVDQWTGFDPARDTVDGVHPAWPGNEKIAARWFTALSRVLDKG
ncbi:SGNH/GDSL hydrolase family protein [Luedemannella helvata]|uniref:SGNH hydrolase-type esterase domain-containing protein n=1 Tax=Luedemannella helvata TaxID=349315 RepID=A0ABP4WNZ0_9ACTN